METQDAPMGAQPDAEVASLRSVRDRLHADFPFVPAEHVESLLNECFGRTCNARVQTFRVLLADRDARALLRSYAPLSYGDAVRARTNQLEGAR